MNSAVALDDFAPRSLGEQVQAFTTLARESRLTLIYGARDCGMTSLLKTGILPSLGRRRRDLALSLQAPAVGHPRLPDRRGAADLANRRSELAVYVDAWSESPIACLQERILAALSKVGVDTSFGASSLVTGLSRWSRQFNLRFLIVFDRFEEYLKAPFESSGARAFAEEWARILAQPSLPVNFLICVQDDARPLMDQFAERLSAFGKSELRLPRLWNANYMVLHRHDPCLAEDAQPTLSDAPFEMEPTRIEPIPWSSSTLRGLAPHRSGAWRMVPIAVVLVLLATVAEYERQSGAKRGLVAAMDPDTPVAALTAAPTSQVKAPAPRAAVHAVVLADADNATDSRVASELSKAIGSAPGSALGVQALQGRPRRTAEAALASLAILPYSALLEARSASSSGKADEALHVLTPLYPDELYFFVRTSSPLNYIHEIRGWNINIGPASGTRAASGRLLYSEMFGATIPATTATNLALEDALRVLVTDEGLDVVISAAPPASLWTNASTRDIAGAIRPLKFDRNHPVNSQVLQSFIPTTAHPSDGPWRGQTVETLAVMSYLVALDPPDHSEDLQLTAIAQALCADLPALRLQGDERWRQVALGSHPDVGWPYSTRAQEAFRDCAPSTAVSLGRPQPTALNAAGSLDR